MTKMRQWTVLTVIAVLVVFAGGGCCWSSRSSSKISGVKAQAATQQQANQVLLQQIAAREAQKKTLPASRRSCRSSSAQVPTLPDEPEHHPAAELVGLRGRRQPGVHHTGRGRRLAAAPTGDRDDRRLPSSLPPSGTLVELPVTMSAHRAPTRTSSRTSSCSRSCRGRCSSRSSRLCPIDRRGAVVRRHDQLHRAGPADRDHPAAGRSSRRHDGRRLLLAAGGRNAPATTTLPGATTPATTATTPATTPASPAATTTPAPTATARRTRSSSMTETSILPVSSDDPQPPSYDSQAPEEGGAAGANRRKLLIVGGVAGVAVVAARRSCCCTAGRRARRRQTVVRCRTARPPATGSGRQGALGQQAKVDDAAEEGKAQAGAQPVHPAVRGSA